MKKITVTSYLILILALVSLIDLQAAEKVVIRVGYFPNVTHAQSLIARQLSRQGKGWYEQRLGPNIEIQWYSYNAGPSAMEAIFASSLDLTYVGPGPALNAYIRSGGNEVRVIAGAASGGAALVVQGDSGIKAAADFRGKKIATPQFGNTQDIACRVWLKDQGFNVTMTGGDVRIIPTANPDQLGLFQRRAVDAVWTVEPWVSRLELEAKGKVFLEEKAALVTLMASRADFLAKQRPLAKKFVEAHGELTRWINEHPSEAQALVIAELSQQMRHPFPREVLEHAWKRLRFTSEISMGALEKCVADGKKVGFFRETISLKRLIEIP